MSTHLIRFVKDFRVEWEGQHNDNVSGKINITFKKGDVVSCRVEPDGPGYDDFDFPCCEVNVSGIDLWNVPDDHFEVLIGETPASMRLNQARKSLTCGVLDCLLDKPQT